MNKALERKTPGEPIRIILADDHKLLREGIKSLIEKEPDITIVGEAENGKEACRIGMVEDGMIGVTARNGFGGERLLELLTGDQLPRIC